MRLKRMLSCSCTFLSLLALVAWPPSAHTARSEAPAVQAVAGVRIVVADMDRALPFYTRVLPFEKAADVEVAGEGYERLEGLFGLRMRVVTLRLGQETVELTDYLAPEGRP